MSARLRLVTCAWCLAAASAVTGTLVSGTRPQLALGLYAVAVIGAVAGTALLATAISRMRRPARTASPTASPFSRLDYLPAVTTRAPRLRWRGSPYSSIGGRERATHQPLAEHARVERPPGSAGQAVEADRVQQGFTP